jgi:hypothetical protein
MGGLSPGATNGRVGELGRHTKAIYRWRRGARLSWQHGRAFNGSCCWQSNLKCTGCHGVLSEQGVIHLDNLKALLQLSSQCIERVHVNTIALPWQFKNSFETLTRLPLSKITLTGISTVPSRSAPAKSLSFTRKPMIDLSASLTANCSVAVDHATDKKNKHARHEVQGIGISQEG